MTRKKQICYFDDFLGHNSLEISKAKGSETALLKNLRRFSKNKNKILILTTRTFLLNSAIEESENLRKFNIKANSCVLKLSEYNNELKEQLLHNHIDESSLSEILKKIIYKNFKYIVNHRNFSPRSVEYITFSKQVSELTPDKFEEFILTNFNNPAEIWRHAYEQQINDFDRMLLTTLISFGDAVTFKELENAFNSRLDYEVNNNNFQRPLNAYLTSFRNLLGGFIVPENSYEEDEQLYILINHSLEDFLMNHLRSNKIEVIRLIESAFYLSQLTYGVAPLIENHKIPFN